MHKKSGRSRASVVSSHLSSRPVTLEVICRHIGCLDQDHAKACFLHRSLKGLHETGLVCACMAISRQHSTAGTACAAQRSTALRSTAQHSTARHGTARHGTARHGTAQHGMARHGTARHGTAQHGTAQHSTAQHEIFTDASPGMMQPAIGHTRKTAHPAYYVPKSQDQPSRTF